MVQVYVRQTVLRILTQSLVSQIVDPQCSDLLPSNESEDLWLIYLSLR
jgi:hypothetical protein